MKPRGVGRSDILMCICTLAVFQSAESLPSLSQVSSFSQVPSFSQMSMFSQSDLHALWHLNFMMDCTTNDTFIQSIIDYATYGCYCGPGGRGQPVDETDRCCLAHDLCYGLSSYYCPFHFFVYLIHYQYTMEDCETDHASITCKPASEYSWWFPWSTCAEAICQCDRSVALCFGANTYHKEYRFYNKLKCRGLP